MYSFTSGTGTFVVPTGGVIVDYLIVGGGGSGGGGVGGGGGAGGLVYAKGVQLPAGSYTWTVGAGGTSVANNTTGNNGSTSSLSNAAFGNIVALGGGGGGGYASPYTGLPGGSGGGAAAGVSSTAYAGGSNAIGQGQSGGSAPGLGAGQYGCGGGGAGAAGGANTATAAGAGGNGLAIPITGSNVYYAGGGGGSQQQTASVIGGLGGLGGGGTGSGQSVYGVTSGAANTGGGGGGASGGTNTAAGGSGIVIVRVYTNAGSRHIIGDGSGYLTTFSAQSNAVTTDVMTISDQGNVSIGLSNALFNYVYGIARDASNNLYATDNRRIRKINAATGIVTTLAGTGHPTQATIVTGNGTGVNLLGGTAIAYNTSLNVLYFTNGASIAGMDSSGNITTFVGSAATGSSDGIGAAASFADIRDMVLDNTNTYLYVSDLINNKIRRITVATSNVQTMVLGGTGNQLLALPDGICFDSNSNCLYLANYGKAVICKILLTGGSLTQTPTVLAGSGGADTYSVDGTGTAASFTRPLGVCVDLTGSNVYVLDGGFGFGSKIRKIVVSSGVVTTIAGGNTVGSLDANGTSALLGYACRTVLIDSFGSNLYFTDNTNYKIRKLNLATCNVTTYAGTGVFGFADGSVPTTTVVNNALAASTMTLTPVNSNGNLPTLNVNGVIQVTYANYGNIQLRNSNENSILYSDSNVAGANTGWIVGQSTNSVPSGSGFAIARLVNGGVSTTVGMFMLSNGYTGIGTNAPTSLLSTYLTGGIWPGSWVSGATNTWTDPSGGAGQWAVFGPGSSNPTGANAGAVGISYNLSSNVGWIQCVTPAINWRPLQIGGSYINFIGGGATAGGAAVGIGYPVGTAPAYTLDVAGTARTTSNTYLANSGGSVAIGTSGALPAFSGLSVTGGLSLTNGYRPLYQVVAGTSLTTGTTPPVNNTNYGTHFSITNSSFNTITLPTSSATTDLNAYWVFRNNTSSYLTNITVTYTGTGGSTTGALTIPPGTSTTIMFVAAGTGPASYAFF
jgi:hypothetical protein